ncbi:MAG: ABC transporter permease, partial [Blastocatellia bacterium]
MTDWKTEIRTRLDGLNLSPAREAEVVEELSQHLEDRYGELLRQGFHPDAAHNAVVAELNESLARDLRRVEQRVDPEPVTFGAKGGNVVKDLLHDLRYGLRVLRKNPGFAAVAILSLALGIGANTAIFQLFDAVFLRTLPVESPQQLAEVKIKGPVDAGKSGHFQGSHTELTYAQFQQIRDRQEAFSGVFAWSPTRFNLSTGGESRYAGGLWVSGECFNVLGVKPLIGRVFAPTDDRPGAGTPGAVISYAFWQHEFGGDTSAIGKTISVEGHTVDVIGVTARDFTGLEVGQSFDVALPLYSEPAILGQEDSNLDRRDGWWLDVIGRLKPGWSIQKATTQVASISPSIFQATLPTKYTPDDSKHYLSFKLAAFPAASGLSQLRGEYQNPLYLLMALAALVLLIACANLANLLLARASGRDKEIAVRLAIGASRGRLVRQLLSESLLVAIIGGVAGAVLGGVLSRSLVSFVSTTDNPGFVDLRPDLRFIVFAGGLSFVTCLLFGLIPAIRASRNSPALAMRSASRGLTADRRHFGLRRALVIGQVALSLVLLAGALLFVSNLRKLLTLDTGFRQNGILVAHLDYPNFNLPTEQRLQLRQELLGRVKAIPGVESAAGVRVVPLSGNFSNDWVEIDGDPSKPRVHSDFNRVSPGYFRTMAIPVLAGRDFGPGDTSSST